MSVFKAVFYRYHRKCSEDFDSLEDALRFLEDGSDDNRLHRVAVIWDGKICWQNPFTKNEDINEDCKEFLS